MRSRAASTVECGSLLPPWVGAACCAEAGKPPAIRKPLLTARSKLRLPHSGSELPQSTVRLASCSRLKP